MRRSGRGTFRHTVTTVVLAACFLFSATSSAFAAPSVAGAQAALDSAVARSEAAQAKLDALRIKAAGAAAQLDELADRREELRRRADSYSNYLYRNGEIDTLLMLMQARDFNEFTSRWTMLSRITADNAQTLIELEKANRAAAASAKRLMAQQQAAAAAAVELEAAERAARQQLASSEAALAAYKRKAAARKQTSEAKVTAAVESSPRYKVRGRGVWKTGVASHYSWTFNGRGASGDPIRPDSMMVAHKTLPFGTLVEFKYRGRTAVARVADRGPFTPGRDWDLGPGTARALDFTGVDEVQYRIVGR